VKPRILDADVLDVDALDAALVPVEAALEVAVDPVVHEALALDPVVDPRVVEVVDVPTVEEPVVVPVLPVAPIAPRVVEVAPALDVGAGTEPPVQPCISAMTAAIARPSRLVIPDPPSETMGAIDNLGRRPVREWTIAPYGVGGGPPVVPVVRADPPTQRR
jgi:hypothetical protein